MTQGYTNAVVLSLFLLIATVPKTTAQGIIQSNAYGYKDCNELAPCASSALTISLDLYKDKTITFTDPSGLAVTYERTQKAAAAARKSGSGGTKSWSGMADFRSANIITSQRDNMETFTGSFVVEDHVCSLNYKNGEQAMSCRHRSTYPPKMAPLRPPKEGDQRNNLRSPKKEEQAIGIFSNATSPSISSSSSTIDVMVVWTKKAECALSGKSKGCNLNGSTQSTMEDLIDLAVAETNTAYSESDVKAQLRLVHAYRDASYVESNNNQAYENALDYITFNSNEVKNKRKEHGADVVAILIDDNKYCGIGWVGPGKDWMFSATGWACATGTYTFGHEVGHNMGCGHDRGSDGECNKNNYPSYAYGWRDPQGSWGTVMSYSCTRNECDNNPSSWCGEIQRFSSSTVTYQGKALGDQYNDCSRQHNDVRAQVAKYFSNGGGGGGDDCEDIQEKKPCKAASACSWRKSDKTCVMNCGNINNQSDCEAVSTCKWKNKNNKCKGRGNSNVV